jgi:hypothetical protein
LPAQPITTSVTASTPSQRRMARDGSRSICRSQTGIRRLPTTISGNSVLEYA